MEAPEKIYLNKHPFTGELHDKWLQNKLDDSDIEYTRTDAFIEMACEYWYKHNREIVKRNGSRATLGCAEFTVNVSDFRNYLKGE